jgi:putative membrane protein
MKDMATRGWLVIACSCTAVLLGACSTDYGRHGASGPSATGGTATTAGTATTQRAALSAQDRDFVMRASQSGMAEVQASQLAVSQAATGEARSFAQRMVRDHTATNDELMRLVRAKGMEVPAALDAAHQAQLDALRARTGSDFDRAYLQDMGVRAHQDAITLYENQARNGSDPDLRAFAARTLNALRDHMAMAEQAAAVAANQ